MKAADVMQKTIIATTPKASVRDIASQLMHNGFSGMPVAERNGKVVGSITEADIIRALTDGKPLESLMAKDIMNSAPITVDVDAPLKGVMKQLREFHIIRVPVTKKGKLVGIISRIDVIKAVLEPEFLLFGS